MGKDKNFEYLGQTFQLQLINQIIVDKVFGSSIIDVMEVTYFENKYFKIIVQMIKEYHTKYNKIPSFDTLEQIIKSELAQELVCKIAIDTLNQIKNISTDNATFVQDKTQKFCKQQELKKAMIKSQKIIDGGEFESYDQVESLVRNALQVGEVERGQTDVFDNLEEVLDADFRHPIPTGIKGIDKLLKGGLARGELGLILAPTGTGKTTILTKFANHAYNMGFNVLQIFFEDNPKIIQRKHFTCWTKVSPDELSERKEYVLNGVKSLQASLKNRLILKKLPSDTLTPSAIKTQIRKIIAEGIKIDMICLDYIDCILPERIENEWKGEGSVIRAFEAMCTELDIALWSAVQGNRCVFFDELVDIQGVGKIKIGNVKVGDMIKTHDGFKQITDVFPVQRQPVYEIKTKSGKSIKVSSKHFFPTGDGSLKSIRSGLNVGDMLLTKK